MYKPLIFSVLENAAHNAAQSIWQAAENVTRYIVLPYFIYQKINQLFHATTQPLLKRLAQSSAQLVASQMIAQLLNHWLEGVWNNIRPIATAFLRPVIEKLLPFFHRIFDENDINFSLREFIPQENAAWQALSNSVLALHNGYHALFVKRSVGELLAPHAYELGQSLTHGVQTIYAGGHAIFSGITAVGPCIVNGPQFCFKGLEVSQRWGNMWQASAPLRATSLEWVTWSLSQVWQTGQKTSIQLATYLDEVLWDSAQRIHQSSGLPSHLIYYSEKLITGVTICATVSMVTVHALNHYFHSSKPTPAIVNHNTLVHLPRGLFWQRDATQASNVVSASPQRRNSLA